MPVFQRFLTAIISITQGLFIETCIYSKSMTKKGKCKNKSYVDTFKGKTFKILQINQLFKLIMYAAADSYMGRGGQ